MVEENHSSLGSDNMLRWIHGVLIQLVLWRYGNLKPDAYKQNLLKVDFKKLSAAGPLYLLVDLDNCIWPKDQEDPDWAIIAHLKAARAKGYIAGICLISNVIWRTTKRLKRLKIAAAALRTPSIGCGILYQKPNQGVMNDGVELAGGRRAPSSRVVVIGDQLFTDVAGGKNIGAYTILVRPSGPDHPITRPKRWIENLLFSVWYPTGP